MLSYYNVILIAAQNLVQLLNLLFVNLCCIHGRILVDSGMQDFCGTYLPFMHGNLWLPRVQTICWTTVSKRILSIYHLNSHNLFQICKYMYWEMKKTLIIGLSISRLLDSLVFSRLTFSSVLGWYSLHHFKVPWYLGPLRARGQFIWKLLPLTFLGYFILFIYLFGAWV